jgi:hypothetical protein
MDVKMVRERTFMIYTHTHVCVCVYACIYIYIYMYIYMLVYTYTYIYICIYIHRKRSGFSGTFTRGFSSVAEKNRRHFLVSFENRLQVTMPSRGLDGIAR